MVVAFEKGLIRWTVRKEPISSVVIGAGHSAVQRASAHYACRRRGVPDRGPWWARRAEAPLGRRHPQGDRGDPLTAASERHAHSGRDDLTTSQPPSRLADPEFALR